MTAATWNLVHVVFHLANFRSRFERTVFFKEFWDHPFELATVFHRRVSAVPGVGDILLTRTVQDQVLLFFGKVFPGRLQQRSLFEFEDPLHRLGESFVNMTSPPSQLFPRPQNLDRTLFKRPLGIGDQQLRVKGIDVAQSAACFAHPLGAVETEHLWRRRAKADVTCAARVVGTVDSIAVTLLPALLFGRRFLFGFLWNRFVLFVAGRFVLGKDQSTAADFERQLDRFGQSTAHAGLVGQPIDNDFNIMPKFSIEFDLVIQRDDFAVDSCSGETLFEVV